MITTFSSSFFSVFKSIYVLLKPELRRYVIIPLFINISLFTATIYYVFTRFSQWMENILPSWLDWLNWLILPLFTLTILIAVFYTFTMVANIIAAPFNSLLAEKYEKLLTGETIEKSGESILKLSIRTISAEFKKISYVMLWFLPLGILTFIPFINIISPFLWILFAIWMLSIEYLDYPMANHDILFADIKQTAHTHKGMTLGLGSGLFIMTSIPFINFIAIPCGVIAATEVYLKTVRKTEFVDKA